MIYRLIYKLLFDCLEFRSRVGTRIFAEHAPANTAGECCVIRIISGAAEYGLDSECDCARPMVQLDFYSENATKAESLYQIARNRLSGFYGSVDVLNASGVEEPVDVSECLLIRPGALVDEPRDASDRWTHRWSADFDIVHSQSVPTLV